MWRRLTLAVCAVIVLGSWAICARTFAVDGSGAYNGVLFALLIFVAASFTLGSAITVVGAWRTEVRLVAPTLVSVLAAASILLLAVAINSRG
jgi:hypothetical protein